MGDVAQVQAPHVEDILHAGGMGGVGSYPGPWAGKDREERGGCCGFGLRDGWVGGWRRPASRTYSGVGVGRGQEGSGGRQAYSLQASTMRQAVQYVRQGGVVRTALCFSRDRTGAWMKSNTCPHTPEGIAAKLGQVLVSSYRLHDLLGIEAAGRHQPQQGKVGKRRAGWQAARTHAQAVIRAATARATAGHHGGMGCTHSSSSTSSSSRESSQGSFPPASAARRRPGGAPAADPSPPKVTEQDEGQGA